MNVDSIPFNPLPVLHSPEKNRIMSELDAPLLIERLEGRIVFRGTIRHLLQASGSTYIELIGSSVPKMLGEQYIRDALRISGHNPDDCKPLDPPTDMDIRLYYEQPDNARIGMERVCYFVEVGSAVYLSSTEIEYYLQQALSTRWGEEKGKAIYELIPPERRKGELIRYQIFQLVQPPLHHLPDQFAVTSIGDFDLIHVDSLIHPDGVHTEGSLKINLSALFAGEPIFPYSNIDRGWNAIRHVAKRELVPCYPGEDLWNEWIKELIGLAKGKQIEDVRGFYRRLSVERDGEMVKREIDKAIQGHMTSPEGIQRLRGFSLLAFPKLYGGSRYRIEVLRLRLEGMALYPVLFDETLLEDFITLLEETENRESLLDGFAEFVRKVDFDKTRKAKGVRVALTFDLLSSGVAVGKVLLKGLTAEERFKIGYFLLEKREREGIEILAALGPYRRGEDAKKLFRYFSDRKNYAFIHAHLYSIALRESCEAGLMLYLAEKGDSEIWIGKMRDAGIDPARYKGVQRDLTKRKLGELEQIADPRKFLRELARPLPLLEEEERERLKVREIRSSIEVGEITRAEKLLNQTWRPDLAYAFYKKTGRVLDERLYLHARNEVGQMAMQNCPVPVDPAIQETLLELNLLEVAKWLLTGTLTQGFRDRVQRFILSRKPSAQGILLLSERTADEVREFYRLKPTLDQVRKLGVGVEMLSEVEDFERRAEYLEILDPQFERVAEAKAALAIHTGPYVDGALKILDKYKLQDEELWKRVFDCAGDKQKVAKKALNKLQTVPVYMIDSLVSLAGPEARRVLEVVIQNGSPHPALFLCLRAIRGTISYEVLVKARGISGPGDRLELGYHALREGSFDGYMLALNIAIEICNDKTDQEAIPFFRALFTSQHALLFAFDDFDILFKTYLFGETDPKEAFKVFQFWNDREYDPSMATSLVNLFLHFYPQWERCRAVAKEYFALCERLHKLGVLNSDQGCRALFEPRFIDKLVVEWGPAEGRGYVRIVRSMQNLPHLPNISGLLPAGEQRLRFQVDQLSETSDYLQYRPVLRAYLDAVQSDLPISDELHREFRHLIECEINFLGNPGMDRVCRTVSALLIQNVFEIMTAAVDRNTLSILIPIQIVTTDCFERSIHPGNIFIKQLLGPLTSLTHRLAKNPVGTPEQIADYFKAFDILFMELIYNHDKNKMDRRTFEWLVPIMTACPQYRENPLPFFPILYRRLQLWEINLSHEEMGIQIEKLITTAIAQQEFGYTAIFAFAVNGFCLMNRCPERYAAITGQIREYMEGIAEVPLGHQVKIFKFLNQFADIVSRNKAVAFLQMFEFIVDMIRLKEASPLHFYQALIQAFTLAANAECPQGVIDIERRLLTLLEVINSSPVVDSVLGLLKSLLESLKKYGFSLERAKLLPVTGNLNLLLQKF